MPTATQTRQTELTIAENRQILAAAQDIIARVHPVLWERMSPPARLIEARSILCGDMLRQAPGTEVPMAWWRDVARSLDHVIGS